MELDKICCMIDTYYSVDDKTEYFLQRFFEIK